MRVLLELIRIFLIFGIAGTIISTIVNGIYINIGVNQYGWLGPIAILLLLFVWYRNKLQFSGWYSGKGKEKLPKAASQILILFSLLLLCAPPVLSVMQMIFQ
ncbi:hypothetical protein Q8G35_21965 [Peribacillus simplex]|uniref:Uncharacterized protein n=2 Tax=Peribacillus TaxID=2675229 RepID=A0AA90PB11_9BACI|nr:MULTISPECIES: hypothetical protein [Peribacillus]MDP1420971.1 hypothetical protein [Peribacillus simplex]MDP1452418.1 hypothetical protein [Peribacillus frigoritolerans]